MKRVWEIHWILRVFVLSLHSISCLMYRYLLLLLCKGHQKDCSSIHHERSTNVLVSGWYEMFFIKDELCYEDLWKIDLYQDLRFRYETFTSILVCLVASCVEAGNSTTSIFLKSSFFDGKRPKVKIEMKSNKSFLIYKLQLNLSSYPHQMKW